MYIHKVLTWLLLSGAAFCSAEVLIVNGTDLDITRYPFMAYLHVYSWHFCGCTILSPTWVLTATHCVYSEFASRVTVQYGVTHINSSGPNIVGVKRIVKHPNYFDGVYYTNDISVLELSEKIIFDYKTVAPVKLPTQNYEMPQGARATVLGWGLEKDDGDRQTNLQEANVAVHTQSECNLPVYYEVKDTEICAGDTLKDFCIGDDGGPLLYKSKNGLIQVGIVGMSDIPCAIFNGVYTKVSKYVDWIKDTIK